MTDINDRIGSCAVACVARRRRQRRGSLQHDALVVGEGPANFGAIWGLVIVDLAAGQHKVRGPIVVDAPRPLKSNSIALQWRAMHGVEAVDEHTKGRGKGGVCFNLALLPVAE